MLIWGVCCMCACLLTLFSVHKRMCEQGATFYLNFDSQLGLQCLNTIKDNMFQKAKSLTSYSIVCLFLK